MSELKTRFIDDTYAEYYNTGKHELAQIYLKSEADQVIAEKDKEIAKLKADIVDLRDDKKSTDAILDERNAELAKLQAIIEERDKTIEGLKEDYSSLKSEAAALQRRVYVANRDARRTRY